LSKTTRLPCATRAAAAPVWPLASLEGLPFGKGRSAVNAWRRMTSPRRVWPSWPSAPCCTALQAAEALNATVVNMRWAKPLDVDLLLQVASQHDALVTVEEGAIMGGAGSAVTEALNGGHYLASTAARFARCVHRARRPREAAGPAGLDADGIQQAIAKRFFTTAEG
jgi:1-deoxy-D-xylulose-5-phosphate synthase